ncbi:MAG: hypothetical protein ABR520_09985 [Mycobacteriales bacterium]|nr:hypothetical protein [Frankia sp.]
MDSVVGELPDGPAVEVSVRRWQRRLWSSLLVGLGTLASLSIVAGVFGVLTNQIDLSSLFGRLLFPDTATVHSSNAANAGTLPRFAGDVAVSPVPDLSRAAAPTPAGVVAAADLGDAAAVTADVASEPTSAEVSSAAESVPPAAPDEVAVPADDPPLPPASGTIFLPPPLGTAPVPAPPSPTAPVPAPGGSTSAATATPTASATATPGVSGTPSVSPTPTGSTSPSVTPSTSAAPTASASPAPTSAPTPSASPTPSPTGSPGPGNSDNAPGHTGEAPGQGGSGPPGNPHLAVADPVAALPPRRRPA